MLTKKQKKVYDYIKSYTEKRGYAPSLEEIRRHARVAYPSTAQHYIKKLQKAGYLHRDEHRPRGIDLSEDEPMVQVPLLGVIAAGQPIEAIQNRETIAVAQSRLPLSSSPGSNIFALKVQGDSMADENIHDGDIVLVKEQKTAENGQKVVALLDNQEATLKTFYKERGRIRLQPANKYFEPIVIRKGEREVAVQGIVIDTVRNLSPQSIKRTCPEPLKRFPLNKIICDDAVTGMKKLPSASFDLIIADPPYNIGKYFGNNHDKRTLPEYIGWTRQWTTEALRLLKPTGTFFIYGFSEILAHISVQFPLEKQRWLIWHYTNKNIASYHFWQRSHEALLCIWKEKPLFNRDAVREPYTEGFLNGAAGKKRKGTVGRFSKSGIETVYKAHERGALPRDVIKIPALAGGAGMNERWFFCKTCDNVYAPRQLSKHATHTTFKHPTQKPIELSRRLIRSAIPSGGGNVLIPFVGTGSECAASKELGCNYVGFELYPEYIRIAEKFVRDSSPIQQD